MAGRRYRWHMLGFYGLLVGLCIAALYWGWWRSVDRFVYDGLLAIAPPDLDNRVLIVGIDEQTLAEQGRWPWDRSRQAQLLSLVMQGDPAALLVDIVYSGESQPRHDDALTQALTGPVLVALPVIFDTLSLNQPLVEVLPFTQLLPTADLLGHVHVELDDDSISRGTYLYQGVGRAHWSHLALALAQALSDEPGNDGQYSPVTADDCRAQSSFTLQNRRCGKVLVPFVGPPGTVPQVSALSLLQGSLPPSILADKVVILGLTASGVADWVTSPVSGEARPMSGVEYNANLFNALVKKRIIVPMNHWLLWFLSLLIVCVVAWQMPRTTPKGMLLLALVGALLPLLLTALALVVFARHLPLATASITALVAYPLWSWRRHEVAWRFLESEMSRLQSEQQHLDRHSALLPASSKPVSMALANLLSASVEPDPTDPLTATAALQPSAIGWHDQSGQRFKLTRKDPFTDLELQLAAALLPAAATSVQVAEPLPGETLAAKIRLLKLQAEQVRLGRDIGLQSLERMASGVCVFSALGQVLFANSAFHRFVAPTSAIDVTAQPLTDLDILAPLVPPLGRSWQDIWRDVVRTGQSFGFESPLDGQRQCFVYCASLREVQPQADITEQEPGIWLVTLTDTTQVRVAQKRREEALAFLSHDLRSPIVSIIALARQAQQDHDASPWRNVESYAEKSLAVSEQFLQLSRLEAQTHFETYELDLQLVLGNAVDQMFSQAQAAQIELQTPALHGHDEGIWVVGNGELLERAFVNLLGNAIKYSAAGTLVSVQAELAEDTVRVAIADQGIGIPAADLPQLFEPYFRSSTAALAEKRGAGLGLRFVKTVVQRHDGELSVSSEPGQGSTFVMTLPRLSLGIDLES